MSVDRNQKIRVGQIRWKKIRDQKILNALSRLYHACECSELNCSNPDCDEMKSLVVHTELCIKKPKKECRACKQLLALCIYHAKRSLECVSGRCPIPFCAKIKHILMIKKKSLRKILKEMYRDNGTEESLEDTQDTPSTNSTATQELPETVVLDDDEITPQTFQNDIVVDVGVENIAQTITVSSVTVQPRQEQELLPHIHNLPVVLNANPEHAGTTNGQVRDNIFDSPLTINSLQQRPISASQVAPSRFNTLSPGDAVNHLKNLLHAHKCLTGELHGGMAVWPCFEASCGLWKNVLRHINHCSIMGCTVLHCASSKSLLEHWRTCEELACQLCLPIRRCASIMQGLTFRGALFFNQDQIAIQRASRIMKIRRLLFLRTKIRKATREAEAALEAVTALGALVAEAASNA